MYYVNRNKQSESSPVLFLVGGERAVQQMKPSKLLATTFDLTSCAVKY